MLTVQCSRNKLLAELKAAISSYLFFWDKWIASDLCNLSATEIKKIQQYVRSNFQTATSGTERAYEESELIKRILRKLETDYPAFKELVVLNFLCSLIRLARDYDQGYDSFMNAPVHALSIPEHTKNALMAFKVYSVGLLAVLYKENDLLLDPAYQRIVEFQLINANPKSLT